MPHSHLDPGWLETFETYYESRVKHVFDLATQNLMQHEELRFMFTEISFLDRWWQDASEAQRSVFKRLVTSGRIEITSGGWVMPDDDDWDVIDY